MGSENKFLCSLGPCVGASLLLIWDEGRGVSWGQAGGWLRCFAHPLGGGVCRAHTQYLVFVPGSSKVAAGFFWSLCI